MPQSFSSRNQKPNTRRRAERFKAFFKVFINLNYIAGFLYAFYFFVTTPRQSQMFERRLWAYECWLILTAYGIFIYLFYLEKSALENHRGMFRFMRIRAVEMIDASRKDLLNWFEQLAADPAQYQFSTHAGITLEQGSLMEPGSIFFTREKFLGIELKLRFQITNIDERDRFEFKLLNPVLRWLKFGGYFQLQQLDKQLTKLSLTIYNHPKTVSKRLLSALFYFSPLRLAAAKQIQREVEFIADQVERRG